MTRKNPRHISKDVIEVILILAAGFLAMCLCNDPDTAAIIGASYVIATTIIINGAIADDRSRMHIEADIQMRNS